MKVVVGEVVRRPEEDVKDAAADREKKSRLGQLVKRRTGFKSGSPPGGIRDTHLKTADRGPDKPSRGSG